MHHDATGGAGIHVATFGDPNVHRGLAALINSLAHHGFKGCVWVGHRGALPAWAPNGRVAVRDGVEVRFVELTTRRPFAYFKPDLLSLLYERHCPDASALVFFDPDIVIARRWSFFEAWLEHGVTLCQDVPHFQYGEDHPTRLAWRELIRHLDLDPIRPFDRYVNAGFIGIPSEARAFLETWRVINSAVERADGLRGGPRAFMVGELEDRDRFALPEHITTLMRPIFMEDQDALNMTIMATDDRISVMGHHEMGLGTSWDFAMAHAVGPDKPWTTSFARQALTRGLAPSAAARTWWLHAAKPLPAATAREIRSARLSMMLAKVIARMWSA